MMAAAMGLRTAFIVQANRMAPGSSSPLGPRKASAPQMQDADEREKAARGVRIDLDLALEPRHQQRRTFVMHAATGHVEGFDLLRRRMADGLEIAVANQEKVLDHLAERGEREHEGAMLGIVEQAHVKDEPVLLDRQNQLVGTAG